MIMSPQKSHKGEKRSCNELVYPQVKDCFTSQTTFRPDKLEETYGISAFKFF